MLVVLCFLGLGTALGFLLRRRPRLISLADTLMAWMLYGLLFFLGVSVGVGQTGAGQFGSLTVQGLALAVTGIAGSIVATRLLAARFFQPSTGSAAFSSSTGQSEAAGEK